MYVLLFTETITILIIEEHVLSLYFMHINQENTENFILGPKPPGPNRQRAETSWGRTGKGPKPLAFVHIRENRWILSTRMEFTKNVYAYILKAPKRN